MHPLGDMRRDILDHMALHRPHIGEGGPRHQHRGDLGGDGAHHANRHAEHHQVGALDGLLWRVADAIAQADAAGSVAGLGAAGVAGDLARKPGAFHRPEHRRGDKPQADQRHAVVDGFRLRFGHCAPCPDLNAFTAAATARQAVSSPMVILSAVGRL